MTRHDGPAADNIAFLEQGIALIETLDATAYAGRAGAYPRGGVGSQMRHCIDFYNCLLAGLDDARVDYSCRRRDPSVELERGVAVAEIRNVIVELERLDVDRVGAELEVRVETGARGGAPRWCRSSLLRELQFLLSHTIHHYALIVSQLEALGVELGPGFAEFGIAPATLDHWRKTETLSG